jgi:SM-20-related protein
VKVRFQEFDPDSFSFEHDPVLVLEEFWTPEELALFQEAMKRPKWKALKKMPDVSRSFPKCGNWEKAEIAAAEAEAFGDRIALSCIYKYIDSFPDIKQRHLAFSYYSYTAGDCLSMHTDLDEGYSSDRQPLPAIRRLALATYMHSEWHPDWGGELILYETREDQRGNKLFEATHCLAPQPGTLVLFTVPRSHRVCRVDRLAGSHKRHSIAGWFMTEH